MLTYTVPAGIRSVSVTLADGAVRPAFLTRVSCIFAPDERVASEKGTMSFKRAGAILTVKLNAVRIPADVEASIHGALKELAHLDPDRAAGRNGAGFCKDTGELGHSLARSPRLSTAQLVTGARLVNRFRRQIGEEAAAFAKELMGPKAAPKDAPKEFEETDGVGDEIDPGEALDAGGARWNW